MRLMWPRRAAQLIVVVVTATAAPAPPAARAEPRMRFVQFNLCGSLCNHGAVNRPGDRNDAVEHIRDLVLELRPHVVVLNEVCQVQLWRLKGILARRNRKMAAAFHAQRTNDRHCPPAGGSRAFGDAVLVLGPGGPKEVWPLPNRGTHGEHRAVLCLPAGIEPKLLACALHLVAADREYNQRQFDDVVRMVRRRSASISMIVAGDFNRRPGRLGRLSDPKRGGRFVDVDAAGNRPTHHGKKIDYILLDRHRFAGPSAEVRSSPYSDHRVLVGEATLRH